MSRARVYAYIYLLSRAKVDCDGWWGCSPCVIGVAFFVERFRGMYVSC